MSLYECFQKLWTHQTIERERELPFSAGGGIGLAVRVVSEPPIPNSLFRMGASSKWEMHVPLKQPKKAPLKRQASMSFTINQYSVSHW